MLSQRDAPKRNIAVLAGSLIPDMFIYVAAIWLTVFAGVTHEELWDDIYFQDPMQTWGAIFNSLPLYATLAAIGVVFRQTTLGKLTLLFGLAAIIHILTDLPVHADDAHRHFWPVSDWRFYSPVSYWDKNYHAPWVMIVETALVLGSITILWRRFSARWVRLVLGLLGFLMIILMIASWI